MPICADCYDCCPVTVPCCTLGVPLRLRMIVRGAYTFEANLLYDFTLGYWFGLCRTGACDTIAVILACITEGVHKDQFSLSWMVYDPPGSTWNFAPASLESCYPFYFRLAVEPFFLRLSTGQTCEGNVNIDIVPVG